MRDSPVSHLKILSQAPTILVAGARVETAFNEQQLAYKAPVETFCAQSMGSLKSGGRCERVGQG